MAAPGASNETSARASLVAQGYDVHRAGWPDFFCVAPNGLPVAVEVKGPGDTLRMNQRLCHEWLRAQGVEVLVVDEHGRPWEE